MWTSAEQYYQAQKFPDDEAYRERIRATRSGHDCWKLGNTYEQLPEQQDQPGPAGGADEAAARVAEHMGQHREACADAAGGWAAGLVAHLAAHEVRLTPAEEAEPPAQQPDGLPADFSERKVAIMHRCNHAKFAQNDDLRAVLLGTTGPITAYGHPFWAKWNAILLERIRVRLPYFLDLRTREKRSPLQEELRPPGERDEAVIETRRRWMDEYSAAARTGDSYKVAMVAHRERGGEELPWKADGGFAPLSLAEQAR